jgi:hypothetical protein
MQNVTHMSELHGIDSDARCVVTQFGNSAIRQFGNSAIRQFGNSLKF